MVACAANNVSAQHHELGRISSLPRFPRGTHGPVLGPDADMHGDSTTEAGIRSSADPFYRMEVGLRGLPNRRIYRDGLGVAGTQRIEKFRLGSFFRSDGRPLISP